MKLQRIYNTQLIQPDDIILFVRKDGSWKIFVDKIITINTEGDCTYLNAENKQFNGNLRNKLFDYELYWVDSSIYNYLDKQLDESFLSIEGLFVNLFDSELIEKIMIKSIQILIKDLSFRIKFIDLVNQNQSEIYDIKWLHDEELRKSDKRLSFCKDKLIKEFELLFKNV